MSEPESKEKSLVALASAMAAGCAHCAENLHPMGLEAGATPEEIEWALCEGLRARETATVIMRRKAEVLMDRPLKLADVLGVTPPGPIAEFVRIAAAAAANSAAEAITHRDVARAAGVDEHAVSVALAIARTVRSKAAGFADEAIDAAPAGTRPGKQTGEKFPTAACDEAPGGPIACCGPSRAG